MSVIVGIRREDKNRWERRVPLTPEAAAELQSQHDLRFLVQPSPIRVYTDDDYRQAGIELSEDLAPASLVFAVKEIPAALLLPGRAYVYFAHVIKGQRYNMPMLRRLLDLGCSLVDYERIADDDNRRLIFFSLHAGYAGMIETLWCLGQRWQVLGRPNPFTELRHAYEYEGLSAAKDHLHQLGERIAQQGFAGWDRPLVFGIAGYGNVARGCHEILNCLPVIEIPVEDLPAVSERPSAGATPLLKVVFKEEDMVEPVMVGAKFDLQDYYRHPQKYRGTFARHLPYLDVLVNTIYWDERYPRLVTRDWTRDHYGTGLTPRLQVIGDISCDIEGSIELTLKPTEPDSPCYVYDPRHDAVSDGCAGDGPVIMAVDNLPCELPREASEHFSAALLNLAPQLAAADWGAAYEQLDLPLHLKKALIVHQGELTAPYQYLRQHLGT